jgi:hypothetical protein
VPNDFLMVDWWKNGGGRDADEWCGRGEVAGNRAIHTIESATHSFSVRGIHEGQPAPHSPPGPPKFARTYFGVHILSGFPQWMRYSWSSEVHSAHARANSCVPLGGCSVLQRACVWSVMCEKERVCERKEKDTN